MNTKPLFRFACIVLAAAMLFAFAGCTPDKPVETDKPTADPGVMNTDTEAPASDAPDSEEPTTKPTAEPPFRAEVPEGAELNVHDYNAVRSFLEIRDENGNTNGSKLNEWYDPDDPATWWYSACSSVTGESEYFSIAGWIYEGIYEGMLCCFNLGIAPQSAGYPAYPLPNGTEIIGELNLSGCEMLDEVSIANAGISSLDISDCPELERLFILDAVNISSITPEQLTEDKAKVFLGIVNCDIRHLRWYTMCHIPKESDPTELFVVTVDLSAEGDGSVGIRNSLFIDDDPHISIAAFPKQGHTFAGWFDKNTGELISTDAEFDLIEYAYANNHEDGLYEFIARFN